MDSNRRIPKFKFVAFVLIVALVLAAFQIPLDTFAASTIIHIVRPGENLSSIASRYGVSVAALQRENGISNPDFIYVGERLRIPAAGASSGAPTIASARQTPAEAPSHPSYGYSRGGKTVYVVRPGDTLYGVSLRFGVSVADIVAINHLRTTLIWVGQRLLIPRGHAAPPYRVAPTGVPSVPTHHFVPSDPSRLSFYYVVRPGDTLYMLALRFHTTISAIKTLNRLTADWLYIGQRLRIPESGSDYKLPVPVATRVSRPPASQTFPTIHPTAAPTPAFTPAPVVTPAPSPTPAPTPTFDKPTSPYGGGIK